MCLVLVIANADTTLSGQPVGPPSAKVDIGLRDAAVAQEEPETKDRLSQNIEDGVGHDFAINTDLARPVGKTPDASGGLASVLNNAGEQSELTWGKLSTR